ncbi:MAG: RagB/SusD family nutrient uptake outer membrane protein [Bacteroidetes bacterium]|nr:RagB/SusD family nutrient uptake outer membrane protein [Bacteroidota bacterium]
MFSSIKIGEVKTDDANIVPRLKGEAYFLRAWTYFYLTNLYGGVPIITKAYLLNDEFEVPRNTYEECINFVVGQLDSAILFLPESYESKNIGRITKGAVLCNQSQSAVVCCFRFA